jgi:hypothetical protein
MRIFRKGAMRYAAPAIARVRGEEPEAMRLRMLFALLDIEGPDPAVWDGPICIHVPKAAGSSILSTGAHWTPGHKPLSFYLHHRPRGRAMPFTFAVVRHPMSRYVSAFLFLQGGGRNALDAEWARRNIPEGMDHNAFAAHLAERPELLRQMHLKPQAGMLKGTDGEIGVDRILRFERLAQDWPAFAVEHGLSPDLPRKNVAAAPGALSRSPPAPPRPASRGCRPPRSRPISSPRSCPRRRPCRPRRWRPHGPSAGPEARCGRR